MAGHSKWANIKHRKAAKDAKKGKVYSKIAREITVAARGGGDPANNPSLRNLLIKARGVNMPTDNIERAIKKGTGEGNDGVQFDEIVYEGYAPGGVAVIVQALTENRNRTASEVRHAFTKAGANMGTAGSVSRGFKRRGLVTVPAEGVSEDRLMELVLENGGDDLELEGGTYSITTEPLAMIPVAEAIRAAGIAVESSEVTLIPDLYTTLTDKGQARTVLNFVEALEDLDDVQNVYTNLDLSDEILAAMEEE